MNDKLSRGDILFFDSLPDEAFRKGCAFPVGDHPTHHVSAEDVHDHVQEIAPPPKVIPKGKFSNDFLAYVIVAKYFFQIPLCRQIEMIRMQGLPVNKGTLTGMLRALLPLLEPLYFLLVKANRMAEHWHVDETGWMNFVQVPGKEGYHWWLWVFVSSQAIVFVLDPSRSSQVPLAHFGPDAGGIVNTDRFSALFLLPRPDWNRP